MRGRPNKVQPPLDLAESDEWQRKLDDVGLDALGDGRELAIREYGRLLEYLRDRADRSDTDAELYLRAVDGVTIDELTHFDLMRIARDLDAPINPADSMFLQIAQRRRMKQLGPVPENHLGVSKESDQVFARVFGLRVPRVEYVGLLTDIPRNLLSGTVLKPERSSDSRGVFYLFAPDNIRSVQHALTFGSWSQMVEAIEQELGPDFVHHERWQVQELIVEDADGTPARDLKFYAFYGEIALIVEASRHTKGQYQFALPDGTVVDANRDFYPNFDDPSLTMTDKGGLPEACLDEVRELSRQIPSPYMRIDYLNGGDGLVFNEMSSAPGRSHTWSDEFDRRLGRLYHEAQIRLINDLLDGKQFARYQRFRRLHRDFRLQSNTHRETDAQSTPVARVETNHLVERRGRPTEPIELTSADTRQWNQTLESRGLEDLLEDQAWSRQRHRMLLEHLRRSATRSDREAALYLRAVETANIDELTHLDLVTVGRTLKADLSTADSFFRSIALRRRKKQLGSVPERSLGLSRATDQHFASALDIEIPAVLYTGPLGEVPPDVRTGTVLAPAGATGSKGAFHLRALNHIRSLQHDVVVHSWADMIEAIQSELGPSAVRDATWQVREYIHNSDNRPAGEIGIYAFYGEIGLVREGTGDGPALCQYFDADGAVAACGRSHEPRLPESSRTISSRGGLTNSRLEPVRALSRQIPAPFMFLNYLDGARGLVFLGMSSAPGMAHTFSDGYDRSLGRMYSEAELRLTNDLIGGKHFEAHGRFAGPQSTGLRPTTAPARSLGETWQRSIAALR